jgi:hypothetical protein
MNKNNTPVFSSTALQAAVDKARPALEGADEARNRISNDIKTLEAYLQSLDLKTPFRFPLGKSFVPTDENEQYLQAALDFGGCASGGIREEALVWGPDSTGRFRLFHEVNDWEGSVEVDVPGGPYFWDESTLKTQAKPLIETKFEVRKRMHPHLARFVKALGEELAVGPFPFDPEDIPF